ncbi:bifunctional tRNA pseudouridine(32) synthase/23S rRNA pseudouridine(746) synthase RluA [Alteromonas sp. CYL-A6]|uniref:bifunctional tRNA pseudouridine(32) synthase/23S rRNA pseudouridine(746) synthase RluA n=1 Tax=Alteromonas nitratireducens TaxID=3390813 RepID=UPI0034BBCBFC
MVNPDFVYNPPLSPRLTLIYQDDDIMVVNKPSGLLSVPGRIEAHKDSMISRAQTVFPTATVVHRLDMATSGLLIFAMHKAANSELSRQFRERIPQKRYFARVSGDVASDAGDIDVPLIVDWPNRPMQKVDWENGKSALTRFEVVARGNDESLVALYPITGRSHQLRLHMQWLGHPILGDRLYATPEAKARAPRLQLHAETLIVRHPRDQRWMHFHCALPFGDYQPKSMPVPQE